MPSTYDQRTIALAELTQIVLTSRKRVKRAYDEVVAALATVDAITAQSTVVQRTAAVGQLASSAASAYQHLGEAISEINKAQDNAGYAEILADIETDFDNTPSDPIIAQHKAQKDVLLSTGGTLRTAATAALNGAASADPEGNATVKSQVNALGTTLRTASAAIRDAITPHLPYTPGQE